MNSTLKKLLCMLLTLTMLCGLLAACGSSSSDSSSSSSSSDSSDSSEEAEEAEDTALTIEENEALFPLEENTTFTIYYPFSPALMSMGYEDPADLNYYVQLEELTNVTLDFTVVSVEALSENFALMCAGGDYTDIISQCASEYSSGAAGMIEDGIVIDLSEYLDYMPHYREMMEEDDDFRKYNYTDDGQIPQFMSYYEDAYVNQGYFVRSDWLEELGLDTPVTYDDWYDVLLAFKTEYDVSTPSVGVPTSGFYGITSDNFTVRDGEVIYIYADEEIQSEYLAMCEEWYAAGLYTTEAVLDDYYSDTDLRGMVTSGDLVLTTTDVDQYLVFQSEVEISAVTYPVLNEGDTPYDVVNQDDAGNGNMVSTTCSDVETLVSYMDYWYSDTVVELANWGVENETFTIDEDGNYSYTEEVLSFSGGLNLATSVYCAGWEPTILDFHRKDAAYTEDQLNAIEIWNETDDSLNFPSFISFTVEEQETISGIFADIETYVDEQYTMFLIGSLNYEDDFEDFVNTLYDMGLQDVIDVYQDAYDRYMAR